MEYSQTRNSPSPVQQNELQLSRATKASAVFSVSNTQNCTKARPDISIINPHSRATIYSQINPSKDSDEGNDDDDEKWKKRMDGHDTIILEQLITTTEEDSENPKSKAREADYRHPYSLQEFQIEPILLPTHLAELKSALELEDLQWIMFRNRVDKFNQTFWETHSTRFEELEEEAQSQKDVTLNQSSDSSSSPIQQQKEQIDSKLDRFYSDWLIDHKLNFMKYNREWWALLPALIKGGWLAQLRNLKWKFACWRYSILSSKLVNYQ
ncbi:hypothetical protein PSTG_08210 [Puccinia striiformis f. sp. tritici PST-78]|uniref:Uncharacterized protein n=1 Tax=Puccinia striiformis f. sp. tritici PST-78 TaxID=1165861 RepID=A0A0L0VGS7_9BASI|nr:hypothetical protein PSTG_08210 [Puccinia striiformis f. sp. tritici PST-78]